MSNRVGKHPHHTPPRLKDIARLAQAALDALPEELAQHTKDVTIHIEDFAEDDVLADLGLESPFDLLGLYDGVSLADKSMFDTPMDVDRIFLYRRPILDHWCETGEDLAHLVRHVLIHEIGHHFGFSDADMEQLEQTIDASISGDNS